MHRFGSGLADFWDSTARAKFVAASLMLTGIFFIILVGVYFGFLWLADLIRHGAWAVADWFEK